MIRVMSRKLVRKSIEMIRKLAEIKDDEPEEDTIEYDEEEEDDYEEEEEELEDDEEWDDDYDDEFEEKTEEEIKEEREERDRKRKAKIDRYHKFWKEFGKNIKLGIIEDPGNRSKLAKLTRWYSSLDPEDLISFEDYLGRVKEK